MGAIGFVVTHFGNRYIVAPEMAEIFMRRRKGLLDAGQAELVPLPHAGGVDILWIDANVPCDITPITVADGDDVEAARRRWGLCRKKRVTNEVAQAQNRAGSIGEAPALSE